MTRQRQGRPLAVILLAGLALACGQTPAGPDLVITPVIVEAVEVTVGPGVPAEVVAHVRGFVGDGCSSVHSTTQMRSGDTVVVTILSERPADAVCIQIALLYDERILLEGTFTPGTYLLRVNDFEQAFGVE